MRRLARAAISYSETHDARPAQGYYGIAMGAGTATAFESRSWVVELLPFMDQASLKEKWTNDRAWDAVDVGRRGGSNREISETPLPNLICPSDDTADPASPSLSYVMNAGIGDLAYAAFPGNGGATYDEIGHSPLVEPFDWNRNGETPSADGEDIKITADSCLTWPILENSADKSLAAKVPALRNFQQIYDGSAVTILFTENVHAGSVKNRTWNSWSNPQVANCAFIVPMSAKLVGGSAKGTSSTKLSAWVDQSAGSPYMNQCRECPAGSSPFPNSGHTGLVFVAYCDGSVSAVSDKITDSVFLQLVTPNGVLLRATGSLEGPLDSGGVPVMSF